MPLIKLENITKDYGDGRGIFDINLNIEKGEVFGFVGTNGAGKTTTIRHIMGFLRPDKGTATVDGLNCWEDSAEIKKYIGYVPGEIAFPDEATGNAFLQSQAQLLGLKDMTYANRIIDILQLDPTANLKRMSKGMKQKTAIVAAFMADPQILILDEPTTGLDPLMRVGVMDLLNEEKKKGKTILMSTHLFEEVEDTCHKVASIKEGRIIDIKSTKEIRHNEVKTFKLEFVSNDEYQRFIAQDSKIFTISEKRPEQDQVIIQLHDENINQFMTMMKSFQIKFLSERKYTLEQYFNSLYKEDKANV
ncbi:MAG: ATP-binding cassette domain-containing protein [Defluviitaleaceae bacterium]|nr:ATP-binding cassette domain-containing protein [Defluviitaleaceae bacterium]